MENYSTRNLFITGIIVCSLVIVGLTILYFMQFHGKLSDNIGDWANFSSFIYGFSTVALTFLNVCLFYNLTSAANGISTESKNTSDGIICAYTKEEDKRSKAYSGIKFLQEYKTAHAELMQLLNTPDPQKVDYRAIRVAACQLESVYKILHNSNQIFPSLANYAHHEEYLEELNGIANQTRNIPHHGPLVVDANLVQFRQFEGLRAHHNSVIEYFEDVMNLIQTDLGGIYANQENG